MPGRNKGLFYWIVAGSQQRGQLCVWRGSQSGGDNQVQRKEAQSSSQPLLPFGSLPEPPLQQLCGKWQSIFSHPQAWSINPEQSDGWSHWVLSLLHLAPQVQSFVIHPSPCRSAVKVCLFSCTYLRKYHSTYSIFAFERQYVRTGHLSHSYLNQKGASYRQSVGQL